MTALSIPADIQEEAANWIVRLSYGSPSERQQAQAEFNEWKAIDPLHAAAATSMQEVISRMTAVRSVAAGNAAPVQAALRAGNLSVKRKRRKLVVATLVLATVFSAISWVSLHTYPPSYLTADIRSTTGEWSPHTLADGSHIVLKNTSAINLAFDTDRRLLTLVKGEVLIQVASDASRPFYVETPDGDIRALGTRFIVDRQSDGTVISMLESSVAIRTTEQREHSIQSSTVLHAGQQVRIQAQSIGDIKNIEIDSVEAAWKNHQVVAHNRPLVEILDEINRHRPGQIFYDRKALAHITMGAVLPLDNTDQALQLLANSLPTLRIRTMSPYLVFVDIHPDSASPTAK